ncbi:MAG: glycoside hydrolase family 5 protein [Sedimentisphaerales bacterium]
MGATNHDVVIETLIDRITNTSDPNGNSPGWYPKILRILVCPHDSDLYGGSPLTFEPNFNPNNPDDPNTQNNEDFNDLLRETIDYCAEKQLYAIIDWHVMTNTYDDVNDTNAFWSYIAPRFANDTHVLFELFNEPVNPGATEAQRWDSVRNDMQTWVDTIRASAPHNLILVGSPSYDQILGPVVYNPIADDNVVYVCHLYPYHWLGHGADPDWYRNQITTCAEQYPVICTEWGFTEDPTYYNSSGSDHYFDGSISNYGQPLKEFFEEYGIGNTAWVLSNSNGWNPPMFYSNWTPRCGDGEMGCFTKDWLYEGTLEQTVALTISKCTVKAGKTQGANGSDIANIKDSFTASGTLAHITPDFNFVDSLEVNIISLKNPDSNLIYTRTIPFSASQVVKGKYTYTYKIPKGGAGAITSLKFDFNQRKNTFAIQTKNINLTGLGAPLQLNIKMGPYTLTGTASETIINGSKKLVPTRLMRMFQDTIVVTKAKAKHNSTTPLSDSLSVTGEIAVADIVNNNMEEPNLVKVDVNIVWGDHTFTIPAGRLVAAADGLDVGLDDSIVPFGINFGDDDFNE